LEKRLSSYHQKGERGFIFNTGTIPIFSDNFEWFLRISQFVRKYLGTGIYPLRIPNYEIRLSVSRFQEKEKRGEMITKNDNIK
jgi:hypothetical protein